MRNLFKLVVLLSFAFMFGACKKDSSFSYENNSEMNLTLQNERLDSKRKFVIRHSGNGSCICEGCKCPDVLVL